MGDEDADVFDEDEAALSILRRKTHVAERATLMATPETWEKDEER